MASTSKSAKSSKPGTSGGGSNQLSLYNFLSKKHGDHLHGLQSSMGLKVEEVTIIHNKVKKEKENSQRMSSSSSSLPEPGSALTSTVGSLEFKPYAVVKKEESQSTLGTADPKQHVQPNNQVPTNSYSLGRASVMSLHNMGNRNVPFAINASSSLTAAEASSMREESKLKRLSDGLTDAEDIMEELEANKRAKRNLPDSFLEPATSGRDGPVSIRGKGILSSFTQQQQPKPNSEPQEEIQLSDEQQAVIEYVVDRRQSIFFTGSAGTGKSLLLREIIKRLSRRVELTRDQIAVTAPTGIAAANINGCTLHSFAGAGLCIAPVPNIVAMINKNKKTLHRWHNTRVLVIDEVSMVDAAFFDKLEEIARQVRNNSQPFGGIQLIICGDFMQLPPVTKGGDIKFCFEAKSWAKCVSKTILLRRVFRQKDQQFVDILNEMRLGVISDKTANILSTLNRIPPAKYKYPGADVTELYALRRQVDDSNRKKLNDLPGDSKLFHANDMGDPNDVKKLDDNTMAPKLLELKIGAQVMLIKNIDQVFVNGLVGKVFGYDTSGTPVVDFFFGDGPMRRVALGMHSFTLEGAGGKVLATRVQVPLVLAYAMSIHKSQGQTLPLVKVDLGCVFEKGQAYVALSRCTSLDGLQVLNFSRKVVMAHPKVIEFNKRLTSIL